MNDRKFEVLKKILNSNIKNTFAVFGSYNLELHGLGIKSDDLDLITDNKGTKEIAKKFGATVDLDSNENYKICRFIKDGIEMHIRSYEKNPLREGWMFEKDLSEILVDGLKIPCLTLECELFFYKKAHRKKDHHKIKLLINHLDHSK